MNADALPLFSSISASFASFRGGRLLCNVTVVSPDEDLRSAICWVLELLGSKPRPCELVEAPSLLATEPADLVLCNLEAAKELLVSMRPCGEPVAADTAEANGARGAAPLFPPVILLCEKRYDKRLVSACLNAGARGYITKPLRIQAIRGVILGHAGSAILETPSDVDGERTPHEKRYEKIQELGRGTFGEVSLVQRRRDGARFALKELMTDKLSAVEQRRVLEELKLHRAFDCPCVVRYYTSWMQGDIAYLLIEFVENGSLAYRLGKCRDSGTELSDSTILDWAGQILIGLLYMHRKDVVHRDLKLDNVLGPDSFGRVKLADFGISKRLNGREMLTSKVGTPEIMAPERCIEPRPGEESPGYGPESDLWSLGVVLYELATLRPPFALDDASNGQSYVQRLEQLFVRIQTEEPSPLPFSRSAALHKIINGGLLRKKPQDRPSASDLCRDNDLGSAIHKFMKKNKLLEHPSILEILDVLPSSAAHGGSRIESSDMDVCTLQRFGSVPGTFKSAMAASGRSFLDSSRLSQTELRNWPGVSDTFRGFIAEASSNPNGIVPAAANSPNEVAEASAIPPVMDTRISDASNTSSIVAQEAGKAAPRNQDPHPLPPRVPLPLPLEPVRRGLESSLASPETMSRRRLREKPGPAGNFHTHPQQIQPSLRGNDIRAHDMDRLAVSPNAGCGPHSSGLSFLPATPPHPEPHQLDRQRCGTASSALSPCSEDASSGISQQHELGDGEKRRSKRGVPRSLDPLDAKLAAKADLSLRQVPSMADLRSAGDFQTPPRHREPGSDRDLIITGNCTSQSTGRSGECTGRSTGRTSSTATGNSGRRSIGERSLSNIGSAKEMPHVGMRRTVSASSLPEFEGLNADPGSGGSASSNSRSRRPKLAPMQPGRPLSVPRLMLPSKQEVFQAASNHRLRTPSPSRRHSNGIDDVSPQDPPPLIREGRARSESRSRASPSPAGRRSGSRGKDLIRTQGSSEATKERLLAASPSAPALTLGLSPVELGFGQISGLEVDPLAPTVPPAPRSLNTCKSDAVLSRVDALLSRSTPAPNGVVKSRPSRNSQALSGVQPGQPCRRSSRSAGADKSASFDYDPAMAWAPLQATPSPSVLT